MLIWIKNLTGGCYMVEAEESDTIENVKHKIFEQTGFPIAYQMIVFTGVTLNDYSKLSDLHINK